MRQVTKLRYVLLHCCVLRKIVVWVMISFCLLSQTVCQHVNTLSFEARVQSEILPRNIQKSIFSTPSISRRSWNKYSNDSERNSYSDLCLVSVLPPQRLHRKNQRTQFTTNEKKRMIWHDANIIRQGAPHLSLSPPSLCVLYGGRSWTFWCQIMLLHQHSCKLERPWWSITIHNSHFAFYSNFVYYIVDYTVVCFDFL